MSGSMTIAVGISLIMFSVILLVINFIYKKTEGKKIQEKLVEEYGK